jgi:hypothetical protein
MVEGKCSRNDRMPRSPRGPPYRTRAYSMLHNSAYGTEIGLPGRILAGLLVYRESTEISPAAGRRPAFLRYSQAGQPKRTTGNDMHDHRATSIPLRPLLGRLVGPSNQYGFLGFLTRARGVRGPPGDPWAIRGPSRGLPGPPGGPRDLRQTKAKNIET